MLPRTTAIFFDITEVLHHGLLSLGVWSTAGNSNQPIEEEESESESGSESEPESDAQDLDDPDNDDSNDKPQGDVKEYGFLCLFSCSPMHRLHQSDPQELAHIFKVICDTIPNSVAMFRELSDNVQDLMAIAKPVRLTESLTCLIVARFVMPSMKPVVVTRRSFAGIFLGFA